MIASDRKVVTSEYATVEVRLDRSTVEQVRRCTTRVKVRATDQTDVWSIETGSWVGTVAVPGLRLLIRPKVRATNLFHLLGIERAAIEFDRAVFDYERDHDLLPACAAFFARALEAAIAHGIARRYVELNDRVIAVRGRVDVVRQARTTSGLPIPIACRFDEHTADTPLNRIVRAAALHLLQLPGVGSAVRRRLGAAVNQLDEVGPLRPSDRLRPVVLTRLDEHYRHVLRLAELVLDGSAFHHHPGVESTAPASAFLVDMNVLYERFVESGLRRALTGRFTVDGQSSALLDVTRAVRMRPDLVFRRGRRCVFVGDAKYKLTASGLGREADYYQLLAYTTALDVPEGVLVYCHDDDAPPPKEVIVKHVGTRLWTRCISLSGIPSEVDAEIDAVADWVASRVDAASP